MTPRTSVDPSSSHIPGPGVPTLQEQFGGIDISCFDELLRGNVAKGMTIRGAAGQP